MLPKMTKGMLGGMTGPMVEAEAADRGAEASIETCLGHGFHSDRSDGRGIGDGRTGHACKDHALTTTTWPRPPLRCPTKLWANRNNRLRDTAGIHQVASQDEKWDGEEGETCGAGVHSCRNHAQDTCLTQGDKKDHCRQAHGHGNGEPNHNEKYQDPKDGRRSSWAFPHNHIDMTTNPRPLMEEGLQPVE